MNILVTGATGFIGRYLVDELIKNKYQVFALVRKTSKVETLLDKGVNLVYGDITDEGSLKDIINCNIGAVFHLAAYVKDEEWKSLYYINVVGSENVCKLCLRLGAERLVYVSSVAVVSGNEQEVLSEDAPYCATNLYGASKIDAERRVIEYRQKGLRVAIIRPPMVYGEGEPHALGKILFLLRHRLLPLMGEGKPRWHLGYVKHVAQGLMLALQKEEFLQGTFFVADEEILTVKEVLTTLSRAIAAKDPYVLPAWASSMLVHSPIIGNKAKFFLKERIYDISRIKSLGFTAQYHTKDALVASARHWLENKA